ncbi:MAG: cyclic nucleotide-binding domain-containing protein, partial [Rhodobacterales bacterium]|nr:cyclic nucleotide-binding domain-containing protein [Rhodobacterales bacterium]
MGERRYRDGDVIYRAGDRADAAFIIVGGQVQITPAGEASPSELTVLGPGDMFGEPADGGLRRTESAQAVGPATLQDLPLAGAPEVAGGGGRGAGGGGPIIEGRTSANPL